MRRLQHRKVRATAQVTFLPVDLRGVAAEMGSEIRVRKLAAEELNIARLNVKTHKPKVQENFLSL